MAGAHCISPTPWTRAGRRGIEGASAGTAGVGGGRMSDEGPGLRVRQLLEAALVELGE